MHIASLHHISLRLALLPALCVPGISSAAEPVYLGAANCRIATLEPAPKNEAVSWDGACKNGHASGKGVLSWRDDAFDKIRLEATLVAGEVSGEGILKTKDYTYTGTLRNGLPHGHGYFEYAAAQGWYEGDVVAGLPHGKGIRLQVDRARYTGEWLQGKRNGWGEATFSNGGSYTGGWKDDKFDGHGKIVYAGSGRIYEGQFKDGRVAGLPEPEIDTRRYAIKEAAAGSRALKEDRITSVIPLASGWGNLTPAQKNTVRSGYPALEAGDEPPFPVKGEGALIDAISRINQALGWAGGQITFHVLIGKDGKPLRVTTYGAPDPALVRAVSQLVMLEQYKPAVCRGQPCEMIYGKQVMFSAAD